MNVYQIWVELVSRFLKIGPYILNDGLYRCKISAKIFIILFDIFNRLLFVVSINSSLLLFSARIMTMTVVGAVCSTVSVEMKRGAPF